MISIILPTCNRYDLAIQNIENILKQEYPKFEIILCDDSDINYLQKNREIFTAMQNLPNTRVFHVSQYDHEGKKTYGLAKARNVGVIESYGETLVFFDDRITPATPDMLSIFEENLKKYNKEKVWLFGDKGAHKTSFVENCSCINKQNLITAGMFCERITKYGGMTRELVGRFTRQNFKFIYVPEALAMPLTKSKDRERKELETIEMKRLLKKMGY